MLSVPCCTDTRHAATLVDPLCDETLVRLPFDSEPVPVPVLVQSWNLSRIPLQYSDRGKNRNSADQNIWGNLDCWFPPFNSSPVAWFGLTTVLSRLCA